MEQTIETNCLYQRACIQYEYRRDPNSTSLEGYKHFCRALGDDVMSFRDFDIWWYRFANGHMDLDYDRSKDPPTPELMDMPVDVMKNIIENLEWKEKFIFRKVSKSCQFLIDDLSIRLERISTQGIENFCHCSIEYQYDFPAADFCRILKNPNTRIDTFAMWETKDPLRTSIQNVLSSCQLHVRHFFSESEIKAGSLSNDEVQYQAMAVLPYLKPEVLESIKLRLDIHNPDYEDLEIPEMLIDELVELEQWKKATTFKCDFPVQKLLDSFAHFHESKLKFKTIEPADVIRLKDMFMNSPNFIICDLDGATMYDEILDEFGLDDEDTSVTFGTLRIEIYENGVIFERI